MMPTDTPDDWRDNPYQVAFARLAATWRNFLREVGRLIFKETR